MRLVSACLLLLVIRPVAAQIPVVADTTSKNVYQFILDYDVPESPAFAALGATPANVMRGGAAKPMVLSVLSNALTNGELASGLAIDLSPMLFVHPQFKSFQDYQKRGGWLRRLLVSVATVQPQNDTASVRIGTGVRINVVDANDPLSDPTLFRTVDSLLRQVAGPPPKPHAEDEIGAPIVLPNKDAIAAAYDEARRNARNRKGMALSIGWAWAGLLHSSVLDGDSLGAKSSSVWISGRYHFASPASVLFTAQWLSHADSAHTINTGVALRADLPNVNGAAEILYDWSEKRLRPGANVEVKVTSGLMAVFAIVTETNADAPAEKPKVRAKTNLKWNFAEMLKTQ